MSTAKSAKPQQMYKYHQIPNDSIAEPMSSQPRFRAPQWTPFDKVHDIIKTGGFDSLGHLVKIIFYCPARRNLGHDPQSAAHVSWVASLLQGSSNVLMSDIIKLVYNHHESQPNNDSVYRYEVDLAFSAIEDPSQIHHARLALSVWVTQLVNQAVHCEVGLLTQNNPNDSKDCTQLCAATNRQHENAHVATWDNYGKFNIVENAGKYQKRAPLAWVLMEAMAAPRDGKGVVIVRQQRPYSNVRIA